MIVIVGLVILVAAVIASVTGVLSRRPAGRPETLPGQAAETLAAQTPASASAPAE
jgi:hypothetical protein